MLKGYKKEEWKSSGSGGGSSMDQRRETVIKGIEKWIRVLQKEEIKGVTKLSRVQDGQREIRVKYHNHAVPVNDNGDYTGILDIDYDELTFWKVTIDQIKNGDWDNRINVAVENLKKTLKRKK